MYLCSAFISRIYIFSEYQNSGEVLYKNSDEKTVRTTCASYRGELQLYS